MPDSTQKLVIVGLDLGDGALCRAWSESGEMPEFAALLASGRWGWLDTTAERLHISAWPSIYTGSPPGEHGVYFTFQPEPGLQGYRRFHPGIYGRPTLWSLLDRAGRRCTVFDPPYVHPEPGYRGTLIHDWGSWAQYLPRGSMPDGALRQLDKHCGCYPLGMEAHDIGFAQLDPADTARRLVKAIEAKAAATCWLMQREPWQMLLTVFGETHLAGHSCWNPGVSQDPAAQPHMLVVYRALDRAVARIRETAGPHAAILIVSGDSVGPNHAGWHLLPQVLQRLGLFAGAEPPSSTDAQPQAPKSFDPARFVRDLLPPDFRKSLARRLPRSLRDKLAQRVDNAGIDWSATRAYCLPTDLEGYVRVNLKGREPQGVVNPGAEYQAVLDEITAALEALRDPTTQRPVVREVVRTDQAFPGEKRALLPDLIVCWHVGAPITAVTSPQVGLVSTPSPDHRTGTHTGPGFLLGGGAGIVPGPEIDSGHLFDLAPSILARFGVEVPEHMRGRILPELAHP